jgi:hypothetical protein
VQLLKNFPAFYGTRRLITVFTRALHWSLSLTRDNNPLMEITTEDDREIRQMIHRMEELKT